MTTSNEAATESASNAGGDIVARAGKYYRVTRYIITAALIIMGLWFGYDGFYGWPAKNDKIREIDKQQQAALARGDQDEANRLTQEKNNVGTFHSDADLLLQKVLFFTLPPLGLALFARWMWISRGRYRLTADDVLHVPGHPPVPLDRITELDKRLWDRKGIAYVGYEGPGGQQGKLKLDDFIYEREPTDAIYKRIEDYLAPASQQQAEEPAQQEQVER
jgi:hypothetical protein